jgi:hypothetical protein
VERLATATAYSRASAGCAWKPEEIASMLRYRNLFGAVKAERSPRGDYREPRDG